MEGWREWILFWTEIVMNNRTMSSGCGACPPWSHVQCIYNSAAALPWHSWAHKMVLGSQWSRQRWAVLLLTQVPREDRPALESLCLVTRGWPWGATSGRTTANGAGGNHSESAAAAPGFHRAIHQHAVSHLFFYLLPRREGYFSSSC